MTRSGQTTSTAAAAGLFVLVVLAAAGHAATDPCAGTKAAAQGAPCASAGDDSIRPFRVRVPDAALADLRRRIAATQWPEKETVADESQGVQLATMQELARYWATDYDWRKVEAKLNASTKIRLVPASFRAVTLAQAAAAREGPSTATPDARAIFAGGCFWCMEAPFDKLPGVLSSTSGYAGGQVRNPTYDQVSSGSTGHAEVVQVLYDPKRITYAQLLDVFWHNIDPLDKNDQFCDKGSLYRSAIFYGNDEERALAEESKRSVEQRLGRPVATRIVPAGAFYPAEEYHQDFYRKNPVRYSQYRQGCGRDRRLKELWGDEAAGHGGSR